jgi:ligand-binding sensor domain-containing protein
MAISVSTTLGVVIEASSGLPDNTVWVDIAEDLEGTMWVVTIGGLGRIDEKGASGYTTLNSPLPHNDIGGLAIDSGGAKWVSTLRGLARYDGRDWVTYNTSNSGLPTDKVGRLAIDTEGNHWIGSWGCGLTKYDGTNWTVFTALNSPLPDDRISSLCVDPRGNLWIGTYGGGLAGYRNGGVDFGSPTAVLEEHLTTQPQTFRLAQNHPNPFNGETAIRFELPAGDAVELTVYELAGQRVTTLVDGLRAAGIYTVRWDGKDDRGGELASGVYLYCLLAGSQVEMRKLLLLR